MAVMRNSQEALLTIVEVTVFSILSKSKLPQYLQFLVFEQVTVPNAYMFFVCFLEFAFSIVGQIC